MSKTVDERVVSMQFDNAHFEKNVQTSMSTLDKLKAKLNFKDAGKGLDNLNSSVKNVNMSGLGSAVDTVRTKFSALEVMGVTALANITNSAVNAGKRIVESLTIAPIRDGFNEYEMTLNAVQTTMAATGKTAEEVEVQLKKLDEYADKTVYGTADMLNNLPKFTNAGVDLEQATTAMIGIANATALAGGDASKASIAFYNLGQAIGTGYLTRMDYNSINNAGIATMEWKNQMVEAAIAQGTLTKVGEDAYKAGNKTLTLQQLFIDGLQEQWATTDVMMKVFSDYGDETTEIGKKAYSSAQDIKTFSMMMESLKATAGTGWKDTWQIIFGDLAEAKVLWTGLTDFISGIITKFADFRNTLLESALGKGFTSLWEKIDAIIKPAQKAAETIDKTVEAVTDLDEIVNKVIRGELGNGEVRFNALTEAGYNYCKVQNKVNEALGNGYRYTDEQIAAQDKLLGVTTENVDATKEETAETSKLTEEKKDLIKKVANMSEEQMRANGYTEDQIAAFKELRNTADKLGIPLNEFIDNMDQIDGRWLLLNSFKNIGQSLVTIFKSMGAAWREIFPPMSADTLFNIIAGFHKLTSNLVMSEETADKLKRTFKGLFAIIDIIATITGGALRIAFGAVKAVLSYFNLDILDVTANIGDAIVGFRDWIDSCLDFTGIIDKIAPHIANAIQGIKDWIAGIKEADNIPEYIISGLINGLINGVKMVGEAITTLAKSIIDKAKEVLGIHSPSTVFFEIGKNTVEGLVNGVVSGVPAAIDVFKGFGKGIKEAMSNAVNKDTGKSILDAIKGMFKKLGEVIGDIDWGQVLALAIGIGMMVTVKKIVDTIAMFAAPLEGLGNMLEGLGDMFESIGKSFKASAFKKNAQAVLLLSIAIALLASSVASLAEVPTGKLWGAIGALAVLAGVVVALSLAAAKMGDLKISVNFGKMIPALVGMAGALLILTIVMKQLSGLNIKDMPTILAGMVIMVGSLAALMLVFGKISETGAGLYSKDVGKMLFKMAAALLVMSLVIKLIGTMDGKTIIKGLAVMAAFTLLCTALIAVSKLAGEHASKAGSMILKISMALLICVGVIKLAGHLSEEEIAKGITVLKLLGTMFATLIAVSILAGKNGGKAGSMLLLMSGALLICVGVIKLVGTMSYGEIEKGLGVILALEILFAAIIAVSYFAGQHAVKAGAMLLMMSGAILILTGVMFLLSKMDPSGLTRSLGCIAVLEILFGGLIAVSKMATSELKTIIALIAAVGVLVVALIGLSFIKPERLAGATAAITMVVGAFAGLVAATSLLKDTTGMVKTLLGMTLVVALLAGILGAMSALGVEGSIQTAGAISTILISMSGALLIASKASPTAMAAVGALALIALVVGLLAGILGLMATFNVTPSMETAAALSLLLISMSGALVLLGAVGMLGPAAFIGIAALATMIVGIGGLVTAIGALMTEFPKLEEFLDKGIPILGKIGEAIGSFFGEAIGGVISGIGSGSGVADFGTELSNFAKNITLFLDKMSSVDPAAIDGAKSLAEAMLILTAADLLDAIANPVIFGDTSNFADQLVDFAKAMVKFSNEITSSDIDIDAMNKVAEAGTAMANMANSIPKTGGWVQDIMGESDMAEFGDKVVAFGLALKKFSTEVDVNNINSEAINKAAEAGTAMADMASGIPKTGGWAQDIMGETDMAGFGKSIVAFGKSLLNFSNTVSGSIDVGSIQNAVDAGNALAGVANNVPKSGGIWQGFAGENDLGHFGANLVEFGKSLIDFSNTVSGSIDVNSVKNAVDAGNALAGVAKNVPKSGGIWQGFTGENDLGNFGANIKDYGKGLKGFSDAVIGVSASDVEAAKEVSFELVDMLGDGGSLTEMTSWFRSYANLEDFVTPVEDFGEALKAYSDAVAGIDSKSAASATEVATALKGLVYGTGMEEMVTYFTDGDFTNFESGIVSFGKAIVGFSNQAAGVDEESVTAAVSAGKSLVSLANSISVSTGVSSLIGGGMDTFGEELISFGTAMKDFEAEIAGIDTKSMSSKVTDFKKVTSQLSGIGKSLGTGITNSVKGSSGQVNKSIASMLNGALKSVNSNRSKFNNAGKALMTGFATGLNSMSSKVVSTSSKITSKAASTLKSEANYNKYYSAGKYVVTGFAAGITDNTYKAEAKARAMASAAAKAAKEELDINSPSKVFRAIGYSVPEGFAMGIDRMSYMASNSSEAMADTAINSMRDSISRIGDAIDADMDTQPTIRPVLDLSDVKSGANSINNMFGHAPSMELLTNVGTINSMMNSRIQNGGNDDVVSAIDKLSNMLGNVGGNTYNVNGVTYDDGSNIAGAVGTLIRAITIEGRA